MVPLARWSWFVLAGVLAACGGTTVSGAGADGGGSGGHSAGTGGAGGGGGGSAGTGGGGGCPAGYADCNGDPSDGCEANLASEPTNCGKCGLKCSSIGAPIICISGVCGVCDCPQGRGDCNSDCSDGCESDLRTDVQNCGFCGNACSAPNATAGCTNGMCTIAACDAGFADCDGDPSNGCEINLTSDPYNCGSCGNLCPPNNGGPPTCSAGSCVNMCCDQPGYASCDGTCNCTDLDNDPKNCGFCGNACASGQSCVSGICT